MTFHQNINTSIFELLNHNFDIHIKYFYRW